MVYTPTLALLAPGLNKYLRHGRRRTRRDCRSVDEGTVRIYVSLFLVSLLIAPSFTSNWRMLPWFESTSLRSRSSCCLCKWLDSPHTAQSPFFRPPTPQRWVGASAELLICKASVSLCRQRKASNLKCLYAENTHKGKEQVNYGRLNQQ